MKTPEISLVQLPGFTIVGVERYTSNGLESMNEAWAELTKRFSEIEKKTTPPVCYGLDDYSRGIDMSDGGFPKYHFIAGWQVTNAESTPDGMVVKRVPDTHSAFCLFEGDEVHLPATFQYILNDWMPANGYDFDPRLRCDFTRYPKKVEDPKQALIEIYVPVVKK